MSASSCSLQKDCVTSKALALALGRVSSPLLVLHVDTRLSSKRAINSCLSNRLFLVLWFHLSCLLIHKMASFQSQSTFNQLLAKTAELRIRLDLLPSGFCCSHPRIALVALSRIDMQCRVRILKVVFHYNPYQTLNICTLFVHNVSSEE
jgi:hypothetical protein